MAATKGSDSATPGALKTKLFKAAKSGDVKVLRKVLDAGVHVDGLNGNNWAALHEACCYGQLAAVEALLAAGADPNIPHSQNGLYAARRRIVHVGSRRGSPPVAKKLSEQTASRGLRLVPGRERRAPHEHIDGRSVADVYGPSMDGVAEQRRAELLAVAVRVRGKFERNVRRVRRAAKGVCDVPARAEERGARPAGDNES